MVAVSTHVPMGITPILARMYAINVTAFVDSVRVVPAIVALVCRGCICRIGSVWGYALTVTTQYQSEGG
jgi:short-subunit dehydrogenase